jgi:hypothetical protein
MPGIINSALNPVEDLDEVNLASFLLEPDYLIGLLQKSFFNMNNYDPDSYDWENITPAQYRAAMSRTLDRLDEEVWDIFDRQQKAFEVEMNNKKL